MWFPFFLQDDIPPIYPTSPGPIPITLAMEHVVLKRSDDGVFHIGGELGLLASRLLCLFCPVREWVIPRNCLHVGRSLLFRTLYFFPAAAQDTPSAEVPKSEKRQPPKEQMFLVPTGESFGEKVRT